MTLTLRLTCLVLSDADDNPNEHIARVEIHDNDIVADLRKLIKQEYAHRLHNFDASDIVLWRCSIPADDNLHETLKTIHFDVSDTRLDRLSPSSLVSKHFTTGLSPETIHILVKVPTLGMTQSPSWDINFGTRPGFNESWCQREETVNALYDALIREKLVQVRGTPGSGKTVLLHLLHRQIRKTYPQAFIRRFDSWLPQGKIEFPSIESRLREVDPRYPRDQISFLLLDDAQDTYWDKLLWIDFLKEVHGGMSTYRVALFCSYGSYTSRTFDSPGTSFKLRAAACFSLRPSIGSSYGILYSHKDFFQVVKRFDPVFAKLDKKLLERIYEWTAGHAGAVFELLHFIQEKKSILWSRSCEDLFTVDDFNHEFPPETVIRRLSLGGFVARGLPNRDDYDMPITNLFRKLLSTGRIEIGHMDINSDTSTIQKCLRLGWLYQEQETDHSTYYLFASPIHFSCIAFSLQPTDELPKFDSLYDLSLEVIKHFKPSQLRVPIRRIAPIAPPGQLTAAPPEAQWQDEFYRATFNVTKGNVRITPEFASARRAEVAGMIDFFIPLKGWGIEITRDGSRFQEHNNRFRDGSAYHAWIESGHMKQYILLDFRTSIPQRAHPNLEDLYHVIFDEKYETFQILDNCLQIIWRPCPLLEN